MIIKIIWVHFLADFVLQSDAMALNKSKSMKWLLVHLIVYSMPLTLFFGYRFALVNAGLHLIVDFVTSRLTSYLWVKQLRHTFFVVIGLDQAIHMTCLVSTMYLVQ